MSTSSAPDDDALRYGVLSPRAIWTAAVVILMVGIGMAVWLLLAYGRGDAQQRNQLEAVKTAGTIVVGTGGAAALLLAARRQRTAEIALKQKDREHAQQLAAVRVTEYDANQRRITELYAKAAEQLGSPKAVVRLAGLYALERLAQDEEIHRQTIVNVVCAYLRMPFTPPPRPASPALDTAVHRAVSVRPGPASSMDGDERYQELQVRSAAQRMLTAHLCVEPERDQKFWGDVDLDLTGATLIDFDLAGCRMRDGVLAYATFIGVADFADSVFSGRTVFTGAQFTDRALFERARFGGDSQLFKAWFTSYVTFEKARFAHAARFDGVRFDSAAEFRGAHLGAAWFPAAVFTERAGFRGTTFAEGPENFGGAARLLNAAVRMNEHAQNEWPSGWAPDTAAEPLSLPDFPGTWRELRYVPPQN